MANGKIRPERLRVTRSYGDNYDYPVQLQMMRGKLVHLLKQAECIVYVNRWRVGACM